MHSLHSFSFGLASSSEEGESIDNRLPMSRQLLRQEEERLANYTDLNFMQNQFFFLVMQEMFPKLLKRLQTLLTLIQRTQLKQRTEFLEVRDSLVTNWDIISGYFLGVEGLLLYLTVSYLLELEWDSRMESMLLRMETYISLESMIDFGLVFLTLFRQLVSYAAVSVFEREKGL